MLLSTSTLQQICLLVLVLQSLKKVALNVPRKLGVLPGDYEIHVNAVLLQKIDHHIPGRQIAPAFGVTDCLQVSPNLSTQFPLRQVRITAGGSSTDCRRPDVCSAF